MWFENKNGTDLGLYLYSFRSGHVREDKPRENEAKTRGSHDGNELKRVGVTLCVSSS